MEEIGGPVSIGGIRVEPGDLLLGDGDGIVVIPAASADAVIAAAIEIEDAEAVDPRRDHRRSQPARRARGGRLSPAAAPAPRARDARGRRAAAATRSVSHMANRHKERTNRAWPTSSSRNFTTSSCSAPSRRNRQLLQGCPRDAGERPRRQLRLPAGVGRMFFHHSLKITEGPGPGPRARGLADRRSGRARRRRHGAREDGNRGSLDRRRRRPWSRVPVLDFPAATSPSSCGSPSAMSHPPELKSSFPNRPQRQVTHGAPVRRIDHADDGVNEADGGCVDVPRRPGLPVHGGNHRAGRQPVFRNADLRAPRTTIWR